MLYLVVCTNFVPDNVSFMSMMQVSEYVEGYEKNKNKPKQIRFGLSNNIIDFDYVSDDVEVIVVRRNEDIKKYNQYEYVKLSELINNTTYHINGKKIKRRHRVDKMFLEGVIKFKPLDTGLFLPKYFSEHIAHLIDNIK